MKNYLIYLKLFFLIPIILILLFVRIFKNFRINKIISHKIGHLILPMEIYICEKKADPKKIPVIWFMDRRIANQFIKKKWSEQILILPHQILEPIYILFKKFKFFSFFIIDNSKASKEVKRSLKEGLKHIDDKNVLLKYKSSIEFSHKEKSEGEKYLKKIGFQKKIFFTFSSRTSDFHNEKDESVRNSNINDTISAVNFLVSKGYGAIRIGKNEKKELNFSNKNIIDYATSKSRSDFLDVYLTSKCEFMITTDSGISQFADLFRKPRLIVNFHAIDQLEIIHLKVMMLFKRCKDLNSGNLISFEEVFKRKLNYVDSRNKINDLGYEFIDNNENEIEKASENFFNFINNSSNFDKDLEKQKKFWKNVEKYFGFKNKNRVIICPDFYSNNKELF